MQTRIRTSVSPETISRVSRLFNGTISDIANELFQNARRAGATLIEVNTTSQSDTYYLTIADNGTGMAFPADCFTLGKTGWSEPIIDAETPAGMGVFSLSPRHTEITSLSHDGKAWTAKVSPDAWTADADIIVENTAKTTVGTTIQLEITRDEFDTALRTTEQAAKYCPVPVTFDGSPVEQVDFLAHCKTVIQRPGYRIGVRPLRAYQDNARTNFHGLTITTRLPEVSEHKGITHAAFIDIDANPDLKLVLPARKEFVRDAAFDEIVEQAERAIYAHIATLPAHSLPYKSYARAQQLGIDVGPAAEQLFRYSPPTADYSSNGTGPREPLQRPTLLVRDANPALAQHIETVIAQTHPQFRLYEPDDAYRGYEWYDSIPNLIETWAVITDGPDVTETQIDAIMEPGLELGDHRLVSQIEMFFKISYPPGRSTRTFSHPIPHVCLQTDYSAALEDSLYLASLANRPTTAEAISYLEHACFCASDHGDCDSYDTQRAAFVENAIQIAFAVLLSETDAITAAAHHAITNAYITVPDGYVITATITPTGTKVSISHTAEQS